CKRTRSSAPTPASGGASTAPRRWKGPASLPTNTVRPRSPHSQTWPTTRARPHCSPWSTPPASANRRRPGVFTGKDRIYAHLETWRPFISFNAGLTALAGAVVQAGHLPDLGHGLVILAVPIVGYLGALYGTDFKDRADDRQTRPHRPIPSGRISEDNAVIAMLLCVGAGFLGASWLGFPAVVMTCAAMAVGVIRAKTK